MVVQELSFSGAPAFSKGNETNIGLVVVNAVEGLKALYECS